MTDAYLAAEQMRIKDKNTKRRTLIIQTFIYIMLILAAIICLIPLYSMIISSTHANADIARKLLFVPGDRFLANYNRLIDVVPIWRGLFNSLVITVSSTFLGLYFSALGGYGFSKYKFKGNTFLFVCVLGTMMIPGQLGIVGFFRQMDMFGMINTYWPLILPSVNNAFAIFFLKQVSDASVPNEMLDSGRIDGCNELQIFHRIALPLLTPSIATIGIFLFIGKWNEFLQPLIILFDNELQPIPVMVASVRGQFVSDYGAQYVGIAISVVPIFIVFALASKQIISNVMAGAIKE
jgi:multiple sugar transport system permease protein